MTQEDEGGKFSKHSVHDLFLQYIYNLIGATRPCTDVFATCTCYSFCVECPSLPSWKCNY